MSEAAAAAVTVVTQVRVREGAAADFAGWQSAISAAVAASPGFLEQSVMPPNPPLQPDWVILQRFSSADAAAAWLHSATRLELTDQASPMLAGPVDVHLVRDAGAGALPAPVSAVIATRIKPGQEEVYRQWERRIAAAQAQAAGFQGYRFEPPIAGVQDDWLAILRFDNEAHLQAWLDSPERARLLEEAGAFTEECHARVVRTGFEQWFTPSGGTAAAPAVWKQNMMVLLLLYPIVFLFGLLVQTPVLMKAAGLPFWLALFVGNVVSVLILTVAVPWTSRRFAWWLDPVRGDSPKVTLAGAALVAALYGVCMLVFSRLS